MSDSSKLIWNVFLGGAAITTLSHFTIAIIVRPHALAPTHLLYII